jgi:hypothetical protein
MDVATTKHKYPSFPLRCSNIGGGIMSILEKTRCFLFVVTPAVSPSPCLPSPCLPPLLDIPIPPVYHHARLVAVWGQRPVLVFFGPRTKCWFGSKTLRRP